MNPSCMPHQTKQDPDLFEVNVYKMMDKSGDPAFSTKSVEIQMGWKNGFVTLSFGDGIGMVHDFKLMEIDHITTMATHVDIFLK